MDLMGYRVNISINFVHKLFPSGLLLHCCAAIYFSNTSVFSVGPNDHILLVPGPELEPQRAETLVLALPQIPQILSPGPSSSTMKLWTFVSRSLVSSSM